MIYFVGPKEYGSPVRIFHTSRGKFLAEMELMREGNPRGLHPLETMPGGRLVEYILHCRYGDHRIRADWFDGTEIQRNLITPLDNIRPTR